MNTARTPGAARAADGVDAADRGPRERAAHEAGVEHPGEAHVVDVGAVAGEQSGVLDPRHPHPRVPRGTRHRRSPCAFVCCRSSWATAQTTYPTSVVATRRLGAETSETRVALLDATEQLMLDSGYAAVSSRRVAAVAGVRPALVHYYFRTMDDLFLAAFRRRAEQAPRAPAARAAVTAAALGAVGDAAATRAAPCSRWSSPPSPTTGPAIRDEIAAVGGTDPCATGRGAHRGARTSHGVTVDECPPIVAAVLIAGISVLLALEQGSLGMSTGHAETITYVEEYLRRLEGERRS